MFNNSNNNNNTCFEDGISYRHRQQQQRRIESNHNTTTRLLHGQSYNNSKLENILCQGIAESYRSHIFGFIQNATPITLGNLLQQPARWVIIYTAGHLVTLFFFSIGKKKETGVIIKKKPTK